MTKAKPSPTNFKNLIKKFPLAILIGILALAFSVFSVYEAQKVASRGDAANHCFYSSIGCSNFLNTYSSAGQNDVNPGGDINPGGLCVGVGGGPCFSSSSRPPTHSQRWELAGWITGAVAGGLIVFGDWVFVSSKIKHSKGKLKPKRK